jgi:WD40 repeat protein
MGVGWSPDSRRLAGIVADRGTVVWDVERAAVTHASDRAASSVTGVGWSPCGRRIAVAIEEQHGSVALWDVTGDRMTPVRSLPNRGALHVGWHPRDGTLAVGGRDGSVRLWDPWNAICLAHLDQHGDAAVHVAWAPDQDTIASASKDGTIHAWQPRGAFASWRVLDAHADQVTAVAFDPTGTLLVSKSRDGTVLIWRRDPWTVVGALAESSAAIGWSVGLAFSPDGRSLATLGAEDEIVRVWDVDLAAVPRVAIDPERIEALVTHRAHDEIEEPRRRVRLR